LPEIQVATKKGNRRGVVAAVGVLTIRKKAMVNKSDQVPESSATAVRVAQQARTAA